MASEHQATDFSQSLRGGTDAIEGRLEADTQAGEVLITDDAGTDYGSDLDSEGEEELVRILAELDSATVVTEPIDEQDASLQKPWVHIPNVSSQDSSRRTNIDPQQSRGEDTHSGSLAQDQATIDVDIPELSSLARVPDEEQKGQQVISQVLAEPDCASKTKEQEHGQEDARTPIERFRQAPKKPLSVTDLVSPSWCELQYWFSLTKFGRIKRTPAMKQGTKVHKELEEQVHTYVEIDVQTKEDTFGLRLWNVIQGLRTLRATGITRELQIWGVIDGEVVNGVMDELSYNCPDPELESTIELSRETSTKLPSGQKTISEFYSSQQNPQSAWVGNPHPTRKIYLTDIKTRATRYLPTGASLRGPQMQLMLYHKLLLDLASNIVPADTIFARYALDAHATFTDSFIKNIAELEGSFIHDDNRDSEEYISNTPDAQVSELSQHNSLTLLWSLMITEFQRTLPSSRAMSDILQVEYRKSADGKVMGNQCFVYDSLALDRYVAKTMDWWKGRRQAKGVDIEEAFKCRACEFAEGCEWRQSKVEEGLKNAREKKRVGEKKWNI